MLYSADFTVSNRYIWNHIFSQAYADNCDYFYQLVDDVQFISPGWSESYTEKLARNNPPNYGVVGFPFGDLISQPFVHRTHISIFGSFYPTTGLKNWYG